MARGVVLWFWVLVVCVALGFELYLESIWVTSPALHLLTVCLQVLPPIPIAYRLSLVFGDQSPSASSVSGSGTL